MLYGSPIAFLGMSSIFGCLLDGKAQDVLRLWDVSDSTNLNLFQCPLCELQLDSHNHLFFECVFSSQVWNHVKVLASMQNIAPVLNE